MINKLVYTFYMMLLSPAITLFLGFKSSSLKFKRWLLTIFITIYGSIIYLSGNNDGLDHLNNVSDHYVGLSFFQFLEELFAILTFAPMEGTNDDVYLHFLSFFIGTVLGLPQLFFVFVAFIYGYFFSGSVLKLFHKVGNNKVSVFFYIFAVIFVCQKNIEGINTVRTWTGLWILFYAAISYFETRDRKYLFLMFIPPFVHIAYFIMAIPTWFIAVFGLRFRKLYVIIYLFSFLFGVNQGVITENLSKTELGASKVRGYYVEEDIATYAIKEKSNNTWYRTLQKIGVQNYALNIIVFTLLFSRVYFSGMRKSEALLFSIGILTLTLSNFTGFLYALANRSQIVGSVFVISSLVLLLKRSYFQVERSQKYYIYEILLTLSTLLYLPFVVYKVADLIYFVSIFIFGFPFLPWLFDDINISIREFIGKITG